MGLKVWCSIRLSDGKVYCCWGVDGMTSRRSCSLLELVYFMSGYTCFQRIHFQYSYAHFSDNVQARRIFRRGVTCVSGVNVYMHKHARLGGSVGMLPQKIFIN